MDNENSENLYLPQKSLEIFVEFKTRTLIETVNLLTKGTTLYLAMLGIFAGYLITQDISGEIRGILLIISLITSILIMISIAAVSWGIYRGMNNIENTLKNIHNDAFYRAKMHEYFRDGRVVFWIILATGSSSLLVLLSVISIFMDGRLIALS